MALMKFTPEQRRENLSKARFKRLEVIAQWEANEHLYKLDYLDGNHWADLATKYKIRMPNYNQPADVAGIRKYLRKTGVSGEEWSEAYGSVKDWIVRNPTWTLYAAVGTMLELK